MDVSVDEILDKYDGFLLDAYGVLVDSERTLPGAGEFLNTLRRRNKPFRVISNDGSTTPEAKVLKWMRRGLEVEAEQLLTPWSVLASEFAPVSLAGKRCHVLGTELSVEMLRRAGGQVTDSPEELDVFILADEMTPNFMEACDKALSLFVHAGELGRDPKLLLVNPDLVYPTSRGYGLTSGAIAKMFESGLQRITGESLAFQSVGKPGPGLFQLGLSELGLPRERVLMLGDQWDTDILGADRAGVPSALVTTGIGSASRADAEQMVLHGL